MRRSCFSCSTSHWPSSSHFASTLRNISTECPSCWTPWAGVEALRVKALLTHKKPGAVLSVVGDSHGGRAKGSAGGWATH